MSTEVEFKDEALRGFLKNIDSRLKDVKNGRKKFVGLLSSIVFRDIMDHFKTETGPEGKWKPWSQAYKESMEKSGHGGNKILQFSGRMRQNFKPTSVRDSSNGITWFNDSKTQDGFGYAGHHDETRPFMWASDQALENMGQQTLAFILDEGIA